MDGTEALIFAVMVVGVFIFSAFFAFILTVMFNFDLDYLFSWRFPVLFVILLAVGGWALPYNFYTFAVSN